jgi:hypothetical protein
MGKGWFSEEQNHQVLKEHQMGIPVLELCRKHEDQRRDVLHLAHKYDGGFGRGRQFTRQGQPRPGSGMIAAGITGRRDAVA